MKVRNSQNEIDPPAVSPPGWPVSKPLHRLNVNPSRPTPRRAANSHKDARRRIYKISKFSQRFASVRDSIGYRESPVQLQTASSAEIGIPPRVRQSTPLVKTAALPAVIMHCCRSE